MVEQDNNLPVPSDSEAQLAVRRDIDAQLKPYKAGGLIEYALGEPEQSMEGIIGSHFAKIALLEARGDKAPERPVYIFNPDNGLLINYSLRRNRDPAKSGLFADVVELDEDGKPRYGVGIVNPFATSTGFVNVSVGDNPYGFAPSYIEMRLDSDDPLQTVPPNIETADLLSMLGQVTIPKDEGLREFLVRREKEREALRNKVHEQQKRQYLDTIQAFNELTNPDFHLIITDRDDPSALVSASSEVGLFPLVVTGEDVLNHVIVSRELRTNRTFDSMHLGESIRELLQFTHGDDFKFQSYEPQWLDHNTVAFVTVDLPMDKRFDSQGQVIRITAPGGQHKIVRYDLLSAEINRIISRSPRFAQIENYGFHPEYAEDGRVYKKSHGTYTHEPYGVDGRNIQEYADWLRKVRLDMALTLYFRGLNQLG
jgi:hypothetical protein